jgi:energy-coupling factor transporter ATP-binding protein EcfA2
MRLLELSVENVRGISTLPLEPAGRNLVIWGPNGCGKSGVVDALDFLLTGQISRLTGAGTDGVSLEDHGPHMGHLPEEATVKARLRIEHNTQPVEVEISRNMASRSVLECDQTLRPAVERVLDVARRGQYVLTRRELHRYVNARAGERGEQVQRLLNISEVEEVRRALGAARRRMSDQRSDVEREVGRGQAAVAATLGMTSFDEALALRSVNGLREALGGATLKQISSESLKNELTPPSSPPAEAGAADRKAAERAIAALGAVVDSPAATARMLQLHNSLEAVLKVVKEQPQMLRDLTVRQLIELGMELIDETGSCPLCEAAWPEDELREHLANRLLQADLAAGRQKEIEGLIKDFRPSIDVAALNVETLSTVVANFGMQQRCSSLATWRDNLTNVLAALASPLNQYLELSISESDLTRLLAPPDIADTLGLIEDEVRSRCPERSPQLIAWDTLTTLESNLRVLESSKRYLRRVEKAETRARALLQCFEAARNNVLGKLYDEVQDRFVSFYRQLHPDDEAAFAANLEPAGAALNLTVDFHGLGLHPPQALHSEGHQDSMGLCLYLALVERLTAGVMDLIVLDDVVTSVDEGHRREISRLLAKEFRDKQFLITTHDKSWAFSLGSEGVVRQRDLIEFYGWNLQTGPRWDNNLDTWLHIDQHIARNEIPDAASELRRASEQFFTLACASLVARVVCKPRGDWELGDVLHPAMEQYGNLIRMAKHAANSWNNRGEVERLSAIETAAAEVKRRSGVDMWQVNASIHYNNWHNLGAGDFNVIVAAFRDLWRLFRCDKCEGMLHVVVSAEARTPEAVRCNCGDTDWNLKSRSE